MVVLLSIASSMGLMVWYGFSLNAPMMSAPVMIMTLAVADGIHILVTFFHELRRGQGKRAALVESIRINFTPVLLTSITTCIGFLSMNFSDSPPFQQLGTVVATGVMVAWAVSIFFLPAVADRLPGARAVRETALR